MDKARGYPVMSEREEIEQLKATNARLVALLGECRTRVVAVRVLCPAGSFSYDHNSKIIARIDAELENA